MTKTFFLNSTVADYGEEEFNYLQKFLLDQGVLHTQGANWNEFIDLKVEESDTPDMGVKVRIGNAVIDTQRNDVNFKVFVFSNAVETLAISENTSGVNRVDAVILKLSRTVEPNALMNNVATIEVVDGTGATALSDEDLQTEIGEDYDFIRLANITVEDSETTILDADIEDTRERVLTTDAIQYSPTVLKFKVVTTDPTSPVEGEMWYNETDNKMRYFDGTNVINMESSAFTAGAGINLISSEISVDIEDSIFDKFIPDLGDGSDGDVTLATDTDLTRDMYYNNLTIEDGVVLRPNGFRIFVKGTLLGIGTAIIRSNGGNGGNGLDAHMSIGGTRAGGTAGVRDYTSGVLPLPTAGVGGANVTRSSSVTGIAGLNAVLAIENKVGSNGGAGGLGTAGGLGGTITSLSLNRLRFLSQGLLPLEITTSGNSLLSILAGGGSGGSGGGGGCSSDRRPATGGGSGASGGVVMVFARKIVNITFEAKGGNGGNGGNGAGDECGRQSGSGGGAGGNGGLIILYYVQKESLIFDYSGGAGGIGGTDSSGNGENGGDGLDGSALEIKI